MIIPIGHDQTIRRIPYVTLGIMAICLLVQLHRTFFAPWPHEIESAAGDLGRAEQALQTAILRARLVASPSLPPLEAPTIEAPPIDPDAPIDPDVPNAPSPSIAAAPASRERIPGTENEPPEQIVAEVIAGTVGSDADPLVRDVRSADRALRALMNRDLAPKMAYRPERGLSIFMIVSAFAHGGWLHLVGNLLFLWMCGCNLEDRWGPLPFAGFYLAGAFVASLAFRMVHHDGAMVGASGAIAAAMGAFLVCYAKANIKCVYIGMRLRPQVFFLPAYLALPLWIVTQLFNLLLESSGIGGGVAYSAHVGGFLFGLAFATAMRVSGVEAKLAPDDASDGGWEEDPEVLRATSIAASDPNGAMAILREVVKRRPEHVGARVELATIAIAKKDAAAIGDALGPAVMALARESRWQEITAMARDAYALGELALDERASFEVVRAAAETGDAKATVQAAKRLQTRFPHSSTMPRVLAFVAEAQSRSGRDDLASATWRRLIDEHPTHALAEKARRALATPGASGANLA